MRFRKHLSHHQLIFWLPVRASVDIFFLIFPCLPPMEVWMNSNEVSMSALCQWLDVLGVRLFSTSISKFMTLNLFFCMYIFSQTLRSLGNMCLINLILSSIWWPFFPQLCAAAADLSIWKHLIFLHLWKIV